MTQAVDIVVSGGGIAGMAAAAAFGAAGFSVVCIDPVPPITDAAAAGADLRSTALMRPSVALLEHVGIWPRLAPHASALQLMRIIEAADQGKMRRRAISTPPTFPTQAVWLQPAELAAAARTEAHLAGQQRVSFRARHRHDRRG